MPVRADPPADGVGGPRLLHGSPLGWGGGPRLLHGDSLFTPPWERRPFTFQMEVTARTCQASAAHRTTRRPLKVKEREERRGCQRHEGLIVAGFFFLHTLTLFAFLPGSGPGAQPHEGLKEGTNACF